MDGPLSSIRVLYRDGNAQLWGVPYRMRPGQSPRDLERAHRDYVPPRYGHYGSKQVSIADWIWLGSPGWWGSLSKERQREIKAFLAEYREYVPHGTYEWSELPRKNPADLLSYQSKVAVGGGGLSPFESTLVLGGLLVVAGLFTYAMLRPSTPVASNVQPVPVTPPVQPIPNPASPGY